MRAPRTPPPQHGTLEAACSAPHPPHHLSPRLRPQPAARKGTAPLPMLRAQAAVRVSGLELGGLVGSLIAGKLSDQMIKNAKGKGGNVGKRVQVRAH